MGTCAHNGQAVAVAARLCRQHGLLPRDIADSEQRVRELQQELLKTGQYIPHHRLADPADLARRATITASSELRLARLPASVEAAPVSLEKQPVAQMLPVQPGPMPSVTFVLDVAAPTVLTAELRTCSRPEAHTPDVTLATKELRLDAGAAVRATLEFVGVMIDRPRYAFVCLMQNPAVGVRCADARVTGLLSVRRTREQVPDGDIGIDRFEFWNPARRPEGHNFAVELSPPVDAFSAANVCNGVARPTDRPNAWVAALDDPAPTLTLAWPQPQAIGRVELSFDPDFDHPMESVLMGHPERAMPFCVKRYRITDGDGRVLHESAENHQARNTVRLARPVRTARLNIEVLETHGPHAPASVFEVRCYEA
jgi:hypothetical protein